MNSLKLMEPPGSISICASSLRVSAGLRVNRPSCGTTGTQHGGVRRPVGGGCGGGLGWVASVTVPGKHHPPWRAEVEAALGGTARPKRGGLKESAL